MTHEPVYIWLAGPVHGKGRPRFVRATGRAYTPTPTVNYEAALRMAGQMAMNGRAPFDGAVRISIIADFAIPASFSKAKRLAALGNELRPTTKPDFDNIAKCAGDSLNGVVWGDDKQITDATFAKRYSEKPGLSIEVRAA
jgi:Holliday junction resolvase RusA-like endonuclease